ncbi:Transposase [Bacteroidales bacterium Barb7]|nr:Transposase [Bacteroidales bacterium Barb7]
MEKELSCYFTGVEDFRVRGRCLHLLSDILLAAVCTCLTGSTDYQDMHLFCKGRGSQLKGLLQLPNGVPSADAFERVFKLIEAEALQDCLESYGRKLKGVSHGEQG